MTEAVQNQDTELEDFTDDRAAQIEAMAKSHQEVVSEDMEPTGEEVVFQDDDGNADESEDPAPEVEEEPEEEAAEEPEEAPEEEPEPKLFTVKVDGVEQQVTEQEMIAAYQMGQAAERRLNDAREVLAEVKALRAESQPKQPTPKTPDDIQKELAELSRQSLEATDADQYAAIEVKKGELYREMFTAELAERERAHQLTQEHQVLQEKHNALKSQVAEKHPDFETILWAGQDQSGQGIVQPRLEQWLTTQPASTRWALFASEDPADPISVFDRYKAETGLVQVDSMNERTERKRGLDAPPAAAKKAVKPKTSDKGEPTGSDIVKAMRKARGQEDEDL